MSYFTGYITCLGALTLYYLYDYQNNCNKINKLKLKDIINIKQKCGYYDDDQDIDYIVKYKICKTDTTKLDDKFKNDVKKTMLEKQKNELTDKLIVSSIVSVAWFMVLPMCATYMLSSGISHLVEVRPTEEDKEN